MIFKSYEVTIGNIFYNISKRYASFHTKLMHYNDWYFSSKEPSNYKHEINLYNWIYNPSRVEFVEGGMLGRMIIKKDNNVLDLCCGDGSYSYLFFSDIAKNIDAIDYDQKAIDYANKRYKKKNINFICDDLLTFDLKLKNYDVIIWRSGSAYFSKEDRKVLFDKIYNTLTQDGKVYIGSPLMDEENFSANQVEVITNEVNFENEFNNSFHITFKQKIHYKNRTNINYILKKNEQK
jgi:chemotaxis methyl-accepting protein methylase